MNNVAPTRYVGQRGPELRPHTYDKVCDLMLQNPTWGTVDLARELGSPRHYVAYLIRSDSFKLHYNQRRAAINAELSQALVTKTIGLTDKVLDAVQKRIVDNPASIPFADLVALSDKLLPKVGVGAPGSPVVQINQVNGTQNVVPLVASAEQLAMARAAIRAQEVAASQQPQISTVQVSGAPIDDYSNMGATVIEGSLEAVVEVIEDLEIIEDAPTVGDDK